jgi:5'-nucleotidase
VSNDDGIAAPGLVHLATALVDSGHDVLVAAPISETSGAGAGIGPIHMMGQGILVEEVELPGLDGVVTLGVDALPALIVIAGCLGAFGPVPDLIVTGINPGRNVGRAALHSGTIGAALTGVHFDKRAIAVSIQAGRFSAFESAGSDHIHFGTAAAVAAGLAGQIAEAPARTVVNCNVPNLPLDALRGIRWAHLARSGLVRSVVLDETGESRIQLELGYGDLRLDDESDEALTALGYVTITPLASVAEDTRPDVRESISRSIAAVAAGLGIVEQPTPAEADGPAA